MHTSTATAEFNPSTAEPIAALLNEATAANYLGLTVRYLQKARVRGDGPPFVRIGNRVRYKLSALKAFIDRREVFSTAQADANARAIARQ